MVAAAQAARQAGLAPSIHNTQPWRWRVTPDCLELHAERARQLVATDPDGRMMIISCGAALHHAEVALAAEGWRCEIHRFPDPRDADLLARIVLVAHPGVSAEAMRMLQTMSIRVTDRRPVADVSVPPQAIEQVRRAAEARGARLHLLRREDIVELAAAAARAQSVELRDPEWMEELRYWVGGAREGGLGIPDSAIPREPPMTTVPGRDFGRPGTLPVTPEHDRAAIYAILNGDEDTPAGWLRGGEALSAAWLVATMLDLSLLPLSGAVQVPATRQTLRHMLANVGVPYLILRLGVPDPERARPPHTPRLPADQTVEVVW